MLNGRHIGDVAGNSITFVSFACRKFCLFVCLCRGLTSQSTIFQSCRDGATASWVINQYFRGVKCLAQGHNTAAVGFEPPTSRSGVRHSTTEPPRSLENFVSGELYELKSSAREMPMRERQDNRS